MRSARERVLDDVVSVFEVVVSVLVLFEFIDVLPDVSLLVSEAVEPDVLLVPVPLAPIELVSFVFLSVVLFIVLLVPLGAVALPLALLLVELVVALGEVDDELLDVWARAIPPTVSAAAAARVVRVCLVVIIRILLQ